MSVVIVGGNERMVCQYENICKGYGCKAKVFAKEKGTMKRKSERRYSSQIPLQTQYLTKWSTVRWKRQRENLSPYADAIPAVRLRWKIS